MTGLSEYTLRESNKILEDAGLIKMNKIYLDPTTCLGRVVDINAYLPEAEDIE
jgi:DNA-binding Lrp family transcriptional regulator